MFVLPEFWFLGMLHLSWLSLDWASGFRPAGHWSWLLDGRFPRARPLWGLARAKLLSNKIDSSRRRDRAWAGPCPPDPWAWAMLLRPSIRPETNRNKSKKISFFGYSKQSRKYWCKQQMTLSSATLLPFLQHSKNLALHICSQVGA